MTREEAIKEIKDMVDSWQKDYAEEVVIATEEIQALNMAIKALEQKPQFIIKSDGTIEQIKDCNNCIFSQKQIIEIIYTFLILVIVNGYLILIMKLTEQSQ